MSTFGSGGRGAVTTPPLRPVGEVWTTSSDQVPSPLRSIDRDSGRLIDVEEDLQNQKNMPERQEKEGFDEQAFLSSWKWVEDYGPGFPVSGNNVKIIHSPDEFYSQILNRTKTARKRVSLASLYLGSGSQEEELVVK